MNYLGLKLWDTGSTGQGNASNGIDGVKADPTINYQTENSVSSKSVPGHGGSFKEIPGKGPNRRSSTGIQTIRILCGRMHLLIEYFLTISSIFIPRCISSMCAIYKLHNNLLIYICKHFI
jgi:hypothetical protein